MLRSTVMSSKSAVKGEIDGLSKIGSLKEKCSCLRESVKHLRALQTLLKSVCLVTRDEPLSFRSI